MNMDMDIFIDLKKNYWIRARTSYSIEDNVFVKPWIQQLLLFGDYSKIKLSVQFEIDFST